ncbi:MAG: ubiquinol-cytochrome c reductase iron-sulfur subunit [Dehalococcoidales bacterium]
MDAGRASSGDGTPKDKGVTRRQFLSRAWWIAGAVLGLEMTVGLVASMWPRLKAGAFGTKVSVITLDEARAMPVGTITYFIDQRFYLSRLETGFLAMYRKCTHVGCVVPWRADDPSEDDLSDKGRFNCPCHGGIYNRYGEVMAGPPLRPFDLFPISIEGDSLVVDTGTINQRQEFNEDQVTKI